MSGERLGKLRIDLRRRRATEQLRASVRTHERDLDDATLVMLEAVPVSAEIHHHATDVAAVAE